MLAPLKMQSLLKIFKKSHFSLLLILFSCASGSLHQGRVDLYGAGDLNSFVFTVSDEFILSHKDSIPDKKNPKITQAEAALLATLLKEKKFCLDDDSSPLFEITSRQEKIFDATFAHLIEENYKARAITPKMYFGKCLKGVGR
jgi:hypothetical protein